MTIWQPNRAMKHEMKNRRKKQQPFPTLCRVCGKPLKNNKHDVCKSCREYINNKMHEERKKSS